VQSFVRHLPFEPLVTSLSAEVWEYGNAEFSAAAFPASA
jgi:hypothetical protein